MSALAQSFYQLAPHVHACRTERHVVFLDLKRDRYFGIGAMEAEALRHQVIGLPSQSQREPTACEKSDDEQHTETLRQMLDHGMLTRRTIARRVTIPASIDRPETALIDGYVDIKANIISRDLIDLMRVSMKTAIIWRCCALARIIARAQRHTRHANTRKFDIEEARLRMAVFNRLRPLLYTASNACLFNSLVVREYLARYNLFPSLVFGVAVGPFRAHCWLQQKNIIINDTPEYVREFTPILVV